MFMRLLASIAIATCALLGASVSEAEDALTLRSGIWLVEGTTRQYGNFRFFVDVARTVQPAGQYEARKVSSTRYVPSNQLHFRGKFVGDQFVAEVQVAFAGYDQPEWRQHTFTATRDDTGAVTKLSLLTGTATPTGDLDNPVLFDTWTYTPWPADRLMVGDVQTSDTAYRIRENEARTEIAEIERSIAGRKTALKAKADEIARFRQTNLESILIVDLAKKDYEAAWQNLVAARRAQPEDFNPAPTVPPALKPLYDALARNTADIARIEQRILDHQSGKTPLSTDSIAAAFSTLDSLKASSARIERAIASRRKELGLPEDKPGNPKAKAAEVAALEAAYKKAGDTYFGLRRQQRHNLSDLELASSAHEHLVNDIARLQNDLLQAQDKLKAVSAPGRLVGLIGKVGSEADGYQVKYEAASSNLPEELQALAARIKAADQLRITTNASRDLAKTKFIWAFDAASAKLDELHDKILINGGKAAAAEFLSNGIQVAVAGAQGGLLGAVIETASIATFQYALNKEGVTFTSFDESELQKRFEDVRQKQAAAQSDPQKECDILGARLRAGLMPSPSELAKAGRPDTSDVTPAGNQAQRIPSNVYNNLANAGLSATVQTASRQGQILVYQHLQKTRRDLLDLLSQVRVRAEAAQVTARDAAAYRSLLFRLGQTDKTLIESGLSAAERRSLLVTRRQLLTQAAEAAGTRGLSEVFARSRPLEEMAIDIARADSAISRAATAAERLTAEQSKRALLSEFETMLAATTAAVDKQNRNVLRVATRSFRTLESRIASQSDALAKFTKQLDDVPSFRKFAGGAIASIAIGVVLNISKNAYQKSLQAEEKALWEDFFAKQLEQSLRYRVWQRASCLYWASLDARAELRQAYYRVWAGYDPNAALNTVVRNDSFRDFEQLTLDFDFKPARSHQLTVTVGGKPCAQSGAAQCRVAPGAFERFDGVFVPIDVSYGPADTGG